MSSLYGIVTSANAGRLMDLQAHTMACAMEESLHALIDDAGVIAGALTEVLNGGMNSLAGGTRGDHLEAQLLPLEDRVIDPTQGVRGFAFDDRAGDIRVVAGLRRLGEHIHDNRLMRPKWTAALVMRVAGIVPTGHDGVLCDAVVLHQLHIDEFLDEFRGQRLSFIIELSLMDVSGFDDLDGVSDRFLRGLHGVQDVLDFVC